MSLPCYPEYKDSGVAWLGEVPGHWEVPQSKRLFRRRKELNSGMACENRLALTMGGVVPRALDDLDGLQASEFETYQIFQKDDLAFKLIDLQNIKTSRVGIVPEMGIMSPAYIRLEANQSRLWPKFGYWYFTDLYNRQIFNQLGGGVRQTLGPEELLVLACTAPPLEEQQTIAAFLDRETGKIDALIAEQQRLVELLAEKRQAVISHAVTKGLNPNAKMKDSGIEWLGEVPEHWEFGPLKRYWGVTDCKHVTAEFVEDGVPLASIREVQSRWVTLEDAKCTTEYFYELLIEGGRRPLPEDLIFSRNATVGQVAQVNSNHPRFAMGQDVVLLRKLSSEYSSDYLQHVIRSPIIILQLANMMIGSTFKRINVEEIRSFIVPFPSSKEQAEIATFLESETERFDALIAEANRAIELLQERRSALISAAVTGKIDVREITSYVHI